MDYAALYRLQDEVLAELVTLGTGFYLGGGTALSRFYLQHRYSDDLDFFSHDAVPTRAASNDGSLNGMGCALRST